MKKPKNVLTILTDNILSYLFVSVYCPDCGKCSLLSVGTIYKDDFLCPECKKKYSSEKSPKLLTDLAQSYRDMYTQLDKVGLRLLFLHKPESRFECEGERL